MTTKQLSEWLFQNAQDDQWWFDVNGETLPTPVTLAQIDSYITRSLGAQIRVLHVSQAAMGNPPWVEVDRQIHPSMESGQIQNQNTTEDPELVRTGQRYVIGGALLSILGYLIYGNSGVTRIGDTLVPVVALASLIVGIIGLVRIMKGLKKGAAMVVVYCVLLLIPVVSLFTLLVLNYQASSFLRRRGYKVGFFGAPPR